MVHSLHKVPVWTEHTVGLSNDWRAPPMEVMHMHSMYLQQI
jgi:hypothetical protein